MKKKFINKKFYIIIPLLILCLLLVKIISNNKYDAIYFTYNDSSVLTDIELKNTKILKVTSLDELIHEANSFNNNFGVILDKSVIDTSNELTELQNWIANQKNIPIIVVGYGNPNYVYFKKLSNLPKKYTPKYSDEQFEEFKQQKGFSLFYKCSDGRIYGNGYTVPINTTNVMQVINDSLKGEDSIEDILD